MRFETWNKVSKSRSVDDVQDGGEDVQRGCGHEGHTSSHGVPSQSGSDNTDCGDVWYAISHR